MTKCGIEKYDKLPSRIGVADVDYMRFKLRGVLQDKLVLENALDKIVAEVKGP